MTKNADGGEISAFGAAIKGVPRWAIAVVAIAVAVAAIYSALRTPDLVSAESATAALRMNEYRKHIGEPPDRAPVTIYDDANGRVDASHYRDRCVALAAFRPDGTLAGSLLIPDILSDKDVAARIDVAGLLVVLAAAEPAAQESRCDRVAHGAVVQEGEDGRSGDVVFWRRIFADGCAHVQAIDVRHNIFGPPRWIVCRH